MELKQIKYFLTIVEEGNISAAAKKLHISQPPLSLQLKLLEDELGVKLIARGARRCTLTDAGRIFYNRAVNISALSESAAAEIEDYKDNRKGTLRLGIVSSAGGVLMPECMLKFNKAYPDIHFEIFEGNSYELIEMLESGVIEVAVVRTPFPADELECIYLDREAMTAIGKQELFAKADSDSIQIEAIGEAPLILYRRFEAMILSVCAERGYIPEVVCKSDDARTALSWAKSGLGIAILPESAKKLLPCDGLISKKIESPMLYTQIAAVSRRNMFLSWAARSFMELFAESSI